MIIFSTPFRGQQVLTPLGSEQTTSLLVVLIVLAETGSPLTRPGKFAADSGMPRRISRRVLLENIFL